MPHFPGWAPIPHLGIIKKLASHMLLILTDEYNTSQVHTGCQQRLTSIPYDGEVCGHRETRERATYSVQGPQGGFIPNRGRKIKYCQDQDGNLLNPASDCIQARSPPPDWVMWKIKACNNHPELYPEAVIVDRDKNAALNIRSIGIAYMNNDGHPDFRPEAFLPPGGQLPQQAQLQEHQEEQGE
ncbi:hypothetical protein BDB00DRAFT_936379, partial [Zychaea mexicana]|uniref:uncharacterized protein n=1 Tax=Zychaea mexicana TaxID=64656 RepID=UPI0022FF2122